MALTPEQRDWLTLFMVPGVGAVRFLRLLSHFQKPGRALRASHGELSDVVGPAIATRVRQYAGIADLESQEKKMQEHGVSLITMDDAEYPVLLAETYDAPVLLFAKGELTEADNRCVSIVGTRRPSSIGMKVARDLAYDLAARGITIVSGLAEGIDTAAHQGALDAGGRTIAVLGCGVDQIYPASNRELRESIARQGCLLSPFVMGSRAIRGNFPRRNLIISGLSLGTLVVEAPLGSGSLLTAKYAAEQGREVFAVPGSAGFANSQGPNDLIRDGARLVEKVDDILLELQLAENSPIVNRPFPTQKKEVAGAAVEITTPPSATRQSPVADTPQAKPPTPEPTPEPTPLPPLSQEEKAVYEVLHQEGSFIDEIALTTRLAIPETLVALTMLELKGLVRQMSGKRFARL